MCHFLHARMALLSETAQQIAATASVIGRSFDLETVTAASGRSEEESVEALEELLARRLILEQESDCFDFAHAQLRSLIYAETSQVRRRQRRRTGYPTAAGGAGVVPACGGPPP